MKRMSRIHQNWTCWFGESKTPTLREIAEHCRRINETDPDIPVIVNDNERLMDGVHRLVRALHEERKTVSVVGLVGMSQTD